MATAIPGNDATFTLDEIALATGGVLTGTGAPAVGVAIDSRAVTEGCLFVAIRGETHDGARFIVSAVQSGARALLVHPGTACPDGIARIEVADTTRALGDLAAFHRRRWGKTLVAITGSAGKTTTKELTSAAFEAIGKTVLKTTGNLNNQFGVPMTLFGLTEEHDLAVLEVGTSGRGEIARLGEIAQPDVAVVLVAAAAHTQGLGTVADVADEKASLFHALSSTGRCVVNHDDRELMARVPHDRPSISFGQSAGADVLLCESSLRVTGTHIRVAVDGIGEVETQLKLIGYAAAIDACAALACVLSVSGGDVLAAAAAGLARALPTRGRMAPLALANGVVVIDDTYNSNPRSTEVSLETLKVLSAGPDTRSIAVLGDMKELGTLSQGEHARIGELCVRSGIDFLVGCGPEMVHATSAAARLAAGRLAPHPTRVAHVLDPLEVARVVRSLWRPGDVVLVKGSRSSAMEHVVDALCDGQGVGA